MDIKEIQEFVREKVVMAAHPKCKTYEEALESDFYSDEHYNGKRIGDWDYNKYDFLGLPLTLSRVLNALKVKPSKIYDSEFLEKIVENSWKYVFRVWKLLTKDGSKVVLEDQLHETQFEIAKKLGYEEEK